MNKRRALLALILGVAVLAAFTLAYAATKMPDKPITIDSKEVFTTKKQSPVVFDHAKHKEFKCDQCHHEHKDGKNVWKEGQEVKKCSACHKLEPQGEKMVKLEKAYHDQCVACHKKLKEEKKKTGPTPCAKCHPKKEGDKKEGEK
jgi:hypothetical protein